MISFANRAHLAIRHHWRRNSRYFAQQFIEDNSISSGTGDLLVSGLSELQDISVKVVSCREIVQESMIKCDMSSVSAKALGEVLTCCLMMGSGLKDQESLQINLVGPDGLRNIMAITDSGLMVRGMVGVPQYEIRGNTSFQITATDLLGGSGQVQVVRNHPSYKRPMNGITLLRDLSIPMNLGLYLAESEQRTAAMITDVKIDRNLCRYSLGILAEALPGADPENVEKCIKNLENIEKKGLYSYLIRTQKERDKQTGMFRDFESCLQSIVDDCFIGMGTSFQWTKTPKYSCSCGVDKVWRTLRLLPKSELVELIETQNSVEVKCEFCGKEYHIWKEEIEKEILNQ